MEQNFPKNKNEICDFLKTAKTAEEFFIVQILSSNLFQNKSQNDINIMLDERDNFYIIAMENVFNNSNFLEAIGKVLEQYKAFQKNFVHGSSDDFFGTFDEVEIKNKKLIFAALVTSVVFIADVFQNLSHESLIYTSERLQMCIKKIRKNFNYQYSSSEIFTVISGVFNKKFYSRLTIKLEIVNKEHCFEKQKISSYLINLVIKLSFKNARLNSLFKAIERDKLNDKFNSFSIFRLSNLIKKQVEDENRSMKELVPMLDGLTSLSIFIEPFKSDKNEENVFNLIGLTLKEFKSKETFEHDLMLTIENASDLIDEIKKYSIKNFKAFSGTITEDSYEWSNKIFINCCKLLGAIGSLSMAVDKKWKIDASVKEFVDWTSSIHKILNKYDIEDDWDKISKYLEQETNKIEWKSSFFTPTQPEKNELDYNETGKKIFYGIIKTILGMINSDGGVLVIGIVEKPEEITDKDVRDSLLDKNGKFFFDVSNELFKSKLDLDGIKRKIQDLLKVETLISVDNFNNLWDIQQISIKSGDGTKEVVIYKIEIIRSDKPIFSVKLERELKDNNRVDIHKSEKVWVSLLKRADARTIYVDPRRHLTS